MGWLCQGGWQCVLPPAEEGLKLHELPWLKHKLRGCALLRNGWWLFPQRTAGSIHAHLSSSSTAAKERDEKWMSINLQCSWTGQLTTPSHKHLLSLTTDEGSLGITTWPPNHGQWTQAAAAEVGGWCESAQPRGGKHQGTALLLLPSLAALCHTGKCQI